MSKDKTVKAQMMFSNEKFPYLPLRELKADALGECPAAHSTVWKIEKFTLKLIFQHFRTALQGQKTGYGNFIATFKLQPRRIGICH